MRLLNRFDKAEAQYRWAIANLAVAGICVLIAAYAFVRGYVVAGLLTIVVSFAAVWNSDRHKRRGDAARR